MLGDRTYEGALLLDRQARTVDVDGRLRLKRLIEGEECFDYREQRRLTIPMSQVRRIEWRDTDREVAA